MKRRVGLCLVCICAVLSACAPGVSSDVKALPELPAYSGPKARVVLGEFRCDATNCGGATGRGAADAMITTMVQSNKFDVVEAASTLGVLTAELNVTEEEDAFQGADLAVIGSIIEFQPNVGGASGGTGGLFGRISGNVSQRSARVTIDIRVVDVKTRSIVSVSRATGEATSTRISGRSYFNLSGGLSTYANTPMQAALQEVIVDAVIDIGDKIPADYFIY